MPATPHARGDGDLDFAAARALSSTVALLARAAGRVLAPWNMTWPQAMSLTLLLEQPEPLNATNLVERLGLGRTAMTAVVDRLEKRGWVERRPHPRDRRVSLVALTDEGRHVAEQAMRAVDTAFAPVLAGAALPQTMIPVTAHLVAELRRDDW